MINPRTIKAFYEDKTLFKQRVGSSYAFFRRWELAEKYIKPGRILDIGAGNGMLSVELKKKGFSVVSCDFSKTNIK